MCNTIYAVNPLTYNEHYISSLLYMFLQTFTKNSFSTKFVGFSCERFMQIR